MSGTAIAIFVLIAVPVLVFALWQLLQEALVKIESGTVGLLIVRGKVSERVLEPGVHFVWPFRQQMIQGYPLRELTYLTAGDRAFEETDFADPPIVARLGDRAEAIVSYTIRFRILPDGLGGIHDRVGPDGIKRLVRDQSRRAVIDEFRSDSYCIDDAFGTRRDKLEAAVGARVTEAFLADGFEVTMFHLREIRLGEVDDAIQATVRARAELDRERAAAEVRALRIAHEAEVHDQLATMVDADVVRYRQLELGREALQRWDGRIVVNDAAVARSLAGSGQLAAAGGAGVEAVPDTPTEASGDGSADEAPVEGQMP